MFCHKKDIKIINKVHKRALRAIHGLFSLDYNELVNTENTTSIHVKHLQILMTEVFKSLNYTVPQIMCDLFKKKDMPYNLRNQKLLQIPPARTITYGTNSLIFKASILWNTLPNEYKTAKSVNIFKTNIKKWSGSSCHCFLCK